VAISLSRVLSRLRGSLITPAARTDESPYPEASPYRAVSILPTRQSCPQAVTLSNTRFLLREAPALPLPMCTWPTSCPCRLQYHDDRRVGDRRCAENAAEPPHRRERRHGHGRRITDL
jgi:hypothetical protein